VLEEKDVGGRMPDSSSPSAAPAGATASGAAWWSRPSQRSRGRRRRSLPADCVICILEVTLGERAGFAGREGCEVLSLGSSLPRRPTVPPPSRPRPRTAAGTDETSARSMLTQGRAAPSPGRR
jgi:hypothetical protein